jgi:hypothetical protein
MPNRVACLLVASAVALAAGPVLAQSSTPAPATAPTAVAPVIVEAPSTPKIIERQSQHFVDKNAVVANPELEQIVRWRDPVCVQVAGLIPNQNIAIEARVANVAEAVGLRVRKPGCRPNIQIVFSENPQDVMDDLAKRHEEILGYYHRHEGARLKKVTHPIQAWHITATLGRSEVIDDPDNMPPEGCGISHNFTSCLQGVFKNVFVVVDNKFLGDKSLGLVTDYLALIALAAPRSLDGCNELPSVVDLFAPAACAGRQPPDGLTPADASYLTALYSADPEQKSWVEGRDIAGRMAKILINAKARGG